MGIRSCIPLLALAALCAGPAQAAEPTGRWLVVFKQERTARSASLLSGVLAQAGVRKAGRGVPQLGIATVDGPPAAIAGLRRDPAVESVSAEWRRDFRRTPNDPGLTQQQPDLPAGTPVQWWLLRENFPAAWEVTTGSRAVVGLLDSGIDGGHPELGPKVASTAELGTSTGAMTDQDGHGTHVGGLACAGADDGRGLAGAGWDCRIALVKIARLRDEDVIDGIRLAVERGAHAINMSFGGGAPNAALSQAIDFAAERGVVLVASASNRGQTDQGAPASQLQPNDAPDIAAGRGLVVTAVDFSDQSAGAGRGPQISLAAYGFYDASAPFTGPIGLLSTYPGQTTPRETLIGDDGLLNIPCGCREVFNGDNRYAYLEGTSMATPSVTAVAALIGALNPSLSAPEKIRLIKETARRSGGFSGDVGWGILDAGRAVNAARRVDRVAPESSVRGGRVAVRDGRGRRALRLRLSSRDPAGHRGLVPSGIRALDVYARRGRGRWRRVRHRARRGSLVLRLRPGVYRFYTRAVDRAGNREAPPRRADLRSVVRG
jgi:subtilisin family serine protease